MAVRYILKRRKRVQTRPIPAVEFVERVRKAAVRVSMWVVARGDICWMRVIWKPREFC